MTADVYSPYKIFYHKEKLDELKNGELPYPTFFQIDLTNVCNLNCNFCWYKVHPLGDYISKDYLDTKKLFDFLIDIEGEVKAIEHTGGGEPLCHPDHNKIFNYCNELGFEQSLVTNGTLFDDETLEIVKDFEWVRFSIDSTTSETYKKIKGVYLFNTAIDNLKKLIEIKNKKNVIGFSFIVCRDNYTEIYEAAKFAKEIGCDNIRFSLAYTPEREKMFEGIWDECMRQIDGAKELEDGNFRVFAFSNRIYDIANKVKSDYCGYHHLVGVLGANGCMYPCCLLKLNSDYNLGSIYENSFDEIWFSDKRKKFIESIKNGCPYSCWMTPKNAIMQAYIDPPIKHVNFI